MPNKTAIERIPMDLESLLAESREHALAREAAEFDRLSGSKAGSLVLFGAGKHGRRTLAGLLNAGIEPLAFCDNNPVLWGTTVEGFPVCSVPDAVRRYGETATFVITIWSGEATDTMRQREEQLRHLGARIVVNWGPLHWKYHEVLLPYYSADLAHHVHEDSDAIRECALLWSDGDSLREFVAQVRWRLLFDFDGLGKPIRESMYFPPDLITLRSDEVFVDCGAFNGDTVQEFVKRSNGVFKAIYAFEPDLLNFKCLKKSAAILPKRDHIDLQQAAVGSTHTVLPFSASGTESSRVGTGDSLVQCVALDEIVRHEPPSFIKMDIEGSELEGLKGARHIIEEHKPVLAICSYHVQNHMWKIPLLIRSISPEYQFYLRPHLRDGWDLVCYAIPKSRLTRSTLSS